MYRWIVLIFVFTLWMVTPLCSLAADGEGNGRDGGADASQEDAATSPWFREQRIANLVAVILFSLMLLFLMQRGRRGKRPFIRPIAGLHALEDGVGRAAEMGRPVVYVPGLTDVSDPATCL